MQRTGQAAALLMASVLTALAVTPAFPQEAARFLSGTVQDSASGKPLSGAFVYSSRAVTLDRSAKDGTYKISAADGERMVVIRRAGYIPALVAIPTEGSEAGLGVTLMRKLKDEDDRGPAQLVDLKIFPHLAAFYQRLGGNYRQAAFFTPDDMTRNSGNVAMMIRGRSGFRSMCVATRNGEADCGAKSDRGPNTIMGSGRSNLEEQRYCQTRIWTDDVGPERSLDDLRTDDVLAIEAYSNPNETPPEFPGSSCVSIRLWMKAAIR